MAAETRIKTNAINNLLSVQSLHRSVNIQLVEVGHTERQIGVSKQLDCLSLCEAHEQHVNVLFDSAFLQQTSKSVCSFNQALIIYTEPTMMRLG